MTGIPILSLLIFLPLLGVLILLLINGLSDLKIRIIKYITLFTTLICFFLSIYLLFHFDKNTASFQFEEQYFWISESVSYHVGLDGISLFFVILTTSIVPICIIASFQNIKSQVKEYLITFLLMETLMIGVFSSLDLITFYLFFEGGLIPMFLIIGIWGGEQRIYATFKFFLYTLAGSVLMLLAVLAIYVESGTTDITALLNYSLPADLQFWLWLAFFASFAVKTPMWPVHTWLPDAHVEAPTAGSVILAAVLLKMGGYGFIRFSLGLFPVASEFFMPLIFILSVVAVIYTSLVALMQTDMKKLIAYSSVAHMGFVTIGIFTVNMQGLQGSIMQMLSHGIVSAALFLCVGVVYDRIHTREINKYGGLVHKMPRYSFVFMVFIMASIGLPGTSGFVGEILILIGAFKVSSLLAVTTAIGIILAAAYGLWLYKRVIFGNLDKPHLLKIDDLSKREIVFFAPLVLSTIIIGVYPYPILDITSLSLENLLINYENAVSGQKISISDNFFNQLTWFSDYYG